MKKNNIFGKCTEEVEINCCSKLNSYCPCPNNVKNFKKGPRDPLTQQKIQHNHAHFTDMALVESKFVKEIINPLLEFLNES